MPASRRSALRLLAAALAAPLCACPRHSAAIPALEHVGFRDDVPDAERGNAVFSDAWWSADGARFVTAPRGVSVSGLRVWDGRTGALLGVVDARAEDAVLLDRAGERLVARGPGLRGLVDRTALVVFDTRDGARRAAIPDDPERPACVLGWTDGEAALVLSRPGTLEVWQAEPPRLVRSAPSPLAAELYLLRGVALPATYNEAETWSVSRDGALLVLPSRERGAAGPPWVDLVELETLEVRRVPLPESAGTARLTSCALSPDGLRLAVGSDRGLWLLDVADGAWGPFVAGAHRRNALMGPLRFSADGARVLALGDQLQLRAIDFATGAEVGRLEPPFDDWEGAVRVSLDGSRALVHHFVSDTLEVVDGTDARSLGWVCAYFCNVRHAPVAVPYAVSPDGRRVVASHRYGAGLWDVDADRLIAPLRDPDAPPAKAR